MNGITNGLYDGLLTGQANGLFDGVNNGLNNGLFNNELYLDVDVQKFINAIGTLTDQQINAVNVLVNRFKICKIWDKFIAIYPFVGGTSAAHKFNLKNSLNTNEAFRLIFNGGWTHSVTGALPNGTNAYAETNINPSLVLQLNSVHISLYSRSNIAANIYDIGGTMTNYIGMILRGTSNVFRILMNDSTVNDVSNTDSRGLFIANRTASNVLVGFRNKTRTHNSTTASVARPNITLWLGGFNFSTPQYSSKQIAFATIGSGLTNNDIYNFYDIIQDYQTMLGRQV